MGSNYIKLEFNDYGYEIYAITGTKKIKLNKQDKMIMHQILKNFKFIKKNDDTYIYPNYRLITLHFSKAKIKPKTKKVNRAKSRRIIAGILLATTLVGGAISVGESATALENDQTSITYELPVEDVSQIDYKDIINENLEDMKNFDYEFDVSNVDEILPNVHEYGNLNIDKPLSNQPESITLDNPVDALEEIENVNEFNYEYENPNDKEALINAEEYMKVFSKYEKIYGVDAKLLCAIGAQESSGVHHTESINGGYATGIMGIEYIWDGGDIRVFNFENNCYETIIVDYSRIGELDYNVKIGAAIFQNYFYNTLKNSDSIEETDYLPFTLQKYNMGPGNMRKVLAYGGNWIDNRDMINAGDKHYFEHVLSRLDNDTVISIRLDDGSYYETKIINTALENQYSRS